MNRKLFHGSADIVSSPEFGKGRPSNDYGVLDSTARRIQIWQVNGLFSETGIAMQTVMRLMMRS